MWPEFMPADHRVELAVLRCIIEQGIRELNVEAVAAALGRSRAALYRQFGSWHGLLAHTHRETLLSLDRQLDAQLGNRRLEFEALWADVQQFLRSPVGEAVRAIRPLIANGRCGESIERLEVELLSSLRHWVSLDESPAPPDPRVVVRAWWTMALAAADWCDEPLLVCQGRELAWLLVAPSSADVSLAEELNVDEATPIEGPLWSH